MWKIIRKTFESSIQYMHYYDLLVFSLFWEKKKETIFEVWVFKETEHVNVLSRNNFSSWASLDRTTAWDGTSSLNEHSVIYLVDNRGLK